MCTVSMVYDHYRKPFEQPQWVQPQYYPWPDPTVQELKKLIEDFKEALKAAKTVDRLTNQPDCEDPKKAELEKRVEELERKLAGMKP